MDKMRMESVDITTQNVEKIGAMFPSIITEAVDECGNSRKSINFELLKQMLSYDVLDGDEAYEFTWVGKKAAIVEANKPIRKTLRPCKEESKDWDTTENMYIEGDNLDVLKLLQENYLGAVKMIYIDPPYNTGNDFIYQDNFQQSIEEYNGTIGVYDDNANRLFQNNESNGRFHSDWCSMIYSRLILSRNLLTNDGLIFISIDDNEVDNLSKIADEIFGSHNFYCKFIWQRRSGSMDSVDNVSVDHEYVLCYGKQKTKLSGIERTFIRYLNPDNDPRGPWIADNLTAGKAGGDVYYPITDPITGYEYYPPKGRYWPYNRETMKQKINEGRIIFPGKQDGRPMLKRFQNEAKNLVVPVSTLMRNYTEKDLPNNALVYALNTKGTSELQEIFDDKVFSFPKSTILIKSFLQQGCGKEDIVLDFFSGSATTAHAVMQMNSEDGGNRKFIMVQLPEPCVESTAAFEAGFKNICEIGKERIRRAGEIIKSNGGFLTQNLDIGFRVFKLDDSNMKDVYYSSGDLSQEMLSNLISNIKEDRNALDLLFGCLLEWGLPLSLKYTSEIIEGNMVHIYNDGDLIACFDEDITVGVVKAIAKRQPLRAVFQDRSFTSSSEKINVEEIFKLLAPNTTIKVI
jgi:adenine-specific DNA-methyltransferase